MKFLGAIVAVGLSTMAIAGCGDEGQVTEPFGAEPVQTMVETAAKFADIAVGIDPWEVVVCQIPQDTTDSLYEPVDVRLDLTSTEIIAALTPVVDYFSRWSHGQYQPNFTAVSGVSIGVDEKSEMCVDRALDKASAATRGVLVIADAQHTEVAVGGWGRPGTPCEESCSAKQTRRAVYVGASDFMPYWKGNPPLDLVEHELGHALDWPHSSTSVDSFGSGVYDSDVDVMSNSAGPRENFPDTRNAPGPLAINMYLAKWLQDTHVASLESGTTSFELVATETDLAVDGVRLLIVAVNDSLVLTVELIKASGDNQHLLHDRVVVHQVEVVGEIGYERRQTVLSDDLLSGEQWSNEHVQIKILEITSDQSVTTASVEATVLQ